MSDADQDEKTESPTGKRLGEAREQGQLPISREVATWVVILSILVIVGWLLPSMMRQLVDYLRSFIEQPEAIALDEDSFQPLMFSIMGHVAIITGLVFALLMAAAIGGVMVQTGFFFALDLLKPDLMKLMPTQGFKKLFSISSLVELVKSFGKLALLGFIAFLALVPVALETPHLAGLPLENILGYLSTKTVHLIVLLLLPYTLIAAGDLFFQRYQYIKNLRMTKEEVKDEYKQMEGDPKIKGRLRQMRVEKARKRMMAQVPKADVIITNPTHYAVALQYDGNKMAAPVVLAKGINLIAERIRALAEENRIPLVSNPPLARALHDTVEVDQAIPTQHYRAVAEIISYVYKLKKQRF